MLELIWSRWRVVGKRMSCLFGSEESLQDLLEIEIMRRGNANEEKIVFSSSTAILLLSNRFPRLILAFASVPTWILCSSLRID